MVSSLLWVDNAHAENKSSAILYLTGLLTQYFPEVTIHAATAEEIKCQNLEVHDHDLILTHQPSIASLAKLAGVDVILWDDFPDLGAKLDTYVQLQRYIEKYPLNLKGWALKEVIHDGNDAVIFRAVNETGNEFAIKRFKYVLNDLPENTIQDFMRRIDTQCGLKSAGLVRIYEGGVCEHAFYLVMEYMKYGTLRQTLKGCGNLPLPHALEWFREIAVSLDCVHKAGLVHRDLKTENIMLREDGALALSDYGVSKSILLDMGFITEGEIHCSPHYVSPEQVSGEVCTQASDIYSLGVIFHELITGCKPYKAKEPFELMMHHVMSPVPVLHDELKRFQPILEKMLAKDFHKRFSVKQLLQQPSVYPYNESESVVH